MTDDAQAKSPLLSRRRVIAGATGALGVAVAGFGYAVRSSPHPHLTSFSEVVAWLDSKKSANLTAREGWPVATALAHCAQSIELSMTGFPALRSGVFRSTVGLAVFHLFDALGGMRHDLDGPIPGAPAITEQSNEAAISRLRKAIAGFSAASQLQPHFAYGQLDHAAYERAHAMHISEHLSRFAL